MSNAVEIDTAMTSIAYTAQSDLKSTLQVVGSSFMQAGIPYTLDTLHTKWI